MITLIQHRRERYEKQEIILCVLYSRSLHAAGRAGIAAIAGGNVGVGLAVGAVAGGLTGYIIGEKKKQQ